MPHPCLLFGGGFGAADVHVFVQLHGVAGDDLSVKRQRGFDGIRGFSHGRRAADHDNGTISTIH